MNSGLILLGVLIFGGIIYLTSTGNPIKMKEAREKIGSAILGVIILLSGYLILTTINPELTILKLPSLKEIGEKYKGKYISNPEKCKPEQLSAIAHEIPVGNLTANLFEQKIKQKEKEVKTLARLLVERVNKIVL